MPNIYISEECKASLERIKSHIEQESKDAFNIDLDLSLGRVVMSLCQKFEREEGVDV